jgi:lipoprotein NlpD
VDRTQAPPAGEAKELAPSASREAKDGVYVVQKGDTLFSIAASAGRDPRDLARWNSIDDPTKLRVGQTLSINPPPSDAPSAATLPIAPGSSAQTRPLNPAGAQSAAPAAVPTAPAQVASAAASSLPPSTAAPAPSTNWAWPLIGKVVDKFDEKRNKGIDIAVREGEPVLAAADGSVVYSGNTLRGYGNLVIIKHDDDFISAYAHNRQILVKQGQVVKRGQRIAEAGKTDAASPILHFEIRRQGKPVDPLQYLPAR